MLSRYIIFYAEVCTGYSFVVVEQLKMECGQIKERESKITTQVRDDEAHIRSASYKLLTRVCSIATLFTTTKKDYTQLLGDTLNALQEAIEDKDVPMDVKIFILTHVCAHDTCQEGHVPMCTTVVCM
jgi:hypothetical protein